MRNTYHILLAFSFFALACNANSLDPQGIKDFEEDSLHEMIVLGSKLDDPYSVENMTKSIASLYPTKADRIVVEPSHYYIRFLPKDDSEYNRLLDCGLELIDHPVDYEIVREGDYYHDPSIRADCITWQYAVVDKELDYPEEIKHEILEECYIPVADRTKSSDFDWEAIERQAFVLSGNESMLASTGTKGKTEAQAPSGRITLRDDERGETVGLKGVQVSCNVFVKIGTAFTDEEGNYSISKKFSSDPRYRIVFKNKKGFGIGFNLILIPASISTLGSAKPSGLDYEISSSSERKLFARAVANNAAYEYYSLCRSDEYSISSPPPNLRIWLFHKLAASSAIMMQQGVMIDSGIVKKYLGEYAALVRIFMPDITIGLRDAYNYSDIYGLIMHELAHASHFMQVGKDYWNTYAEFVLSSYISSGFIFYGTGLEKNNGYCEVGETWAYYCQTKFVRDRYRDNGKIYGTNYWFHPQIFLYLDERGLSWWKIFAALTSDIYEREKLKKKLISLYPESKTSINQAFSRYQ